jgi:imidazolonepropionase-like amidohydrolase
VAESLATATGAAAAACGLGARAGKLARGYGAHILAVGGHLESNVHALLHPRALLLRGTPVMLDGQPVAGRPGSGQHRTPQT